MQKLTTKDGASQDLTTENLKALKEIFPEAFTDGCLAIDVLRQLIGEEIEAGEEKFGLNWHGKKPARQISLTPSPGTLRPCPEQSVDWDTSKNLFLEGDNLEVLKLLQKSYAHKINLIYIDPPYNTDGDFIYSDKYQDTLSAYFKYTNQTDEDGLRTSSNTESSGRKHTNWLNMMLPRLKLARNLLSASGVIVCHIDEHEFSNLTALMDEVFGSENNLGPIIWDKRNPKGDATKIATQHEYLIVYAKNIDTLRETQQLKRPKENAQRMLAKAKALFAKVGSKHVPSDLKSAAKIYDLPITLDKYQKPYSLVEVNGEYRDWLKRQDLSGGEAAYKHIDANGEVFRTVSMAWPNKQQAPDEYCIPLTHPITGKPCPAPDRGWRNPPTTMSALLAKGLIIFGENETKQPERKYLLCENLEENIPSVIPFGGSDDALLKKLGIPFDNPKPLKFAKTIMNYFLKNDGIVLDFFAGSGTAAHACLQLNVEQQKQLRYIMIQLPEALNPKKREQKAAFAFCQNNNLSPNIAEISKERIRRAAAKIIEDNPEYDLDIGFKVFKLATSNIHSWNPDNHDLEQTLIEHTEHLVDGRSEEDVLYELLLIRGIELTEPISKEKTLGKTIYSVDASNSLIACLDTAISSEDVEALAQRIIKLCSDKNSSSDTQIIFRDSAFANDITKTNLTAILEQHDLNHVRSI